MQEIFMEMLLKRQREMQEEYFPEIEKLSKEEQMLINTRALIHETIEVERELNWKHWKKVHPVDDHAIKEEIVDQFIFLLNEINIMGMSSTEFFKRTQEKISINIARQKSGY